MNAPLSHYLVRFSSEAAGEIVIPARMVAEPTITLGVAELEERLAEARETARTVADTAHAIDRAGLIADHGAAIDAALTAARADWCATEAERITGLVEGAFAALHETLATQIAKVLRPLLAEALRERTLATLADALDRLLDDPAHPAITLTGPADLVAAIGAKGVRAELALVASDTLDAVVTAGGALVETKLSAALADLAATET